ncbi:MAG: hypothetical protein JNM17_18800 [Archangium sp.]|nr:hypothetical protein [Archangium sp.]
MGFLFKKKPAHDAIGVAVQRLTAFERLQATTPGFEFLPVGDWFAVAPCLVAGKQQELVTARQLEQLQLTFEEAMRCGMRNLAPGLPEYLSREGLATWEGRGAETLVMVGPALAADAPLRGEAVLMVPREGLAMMAGADDTPALTRMLDRAEAEYANDDHLSLVALAFEGTEATAWLPPDDHPLHARFHLAALRTELDDARTLRAMLPDDDFPLAELSVVDRDGGALVATWRHGTDVIVPAADRVRFIDTKEPLPTFEIDLSTYLLFFPLAATTAIKTPESDESRLIRLHADFFPTPHERRFMAQLMALRLQNPEREFNAVQAVELLAAWDAREPLLAHPQEEGVRLEAPDLRVATATYEDFGERINLLGAEDQHRFHVRRAAVLGEHRAG